MIDEKIVECIIYHLYEVTLEQGRELRQAYFRRYTLVSKAWEGPASEKLYRNPCFGTARRAHGFQTCLKHHPQRRPLVKKLIFGEGSTSDVKDWPTPQTVPDITRLSPNVEIIGFDGLHNVDLEAFRLALYDAQCLRELRACDMMPKPWTYISYFWDYVVTECPQVTRLRLYGLQSIEDAPPFPLNGLASLALPKRTARQLTHLSLNSCSIGSAELNAMLDASANSLKMLYLEYPRGLDDHALLEVLNNVDGHLKELTIEGFSEQNSLRKPKLENMVSHIISSCKNLEIFDFREALADVTLFKHMRGSKLRIWSFTCGKAVRPEHWIEAFEQGGIPKGRCRVYTQGWTSSDIRRVRVAAWQAGVSWLISDDALRDMDDT